MRSKRGRRQRSSPVRRKGFLAEHRIARKLTVISLILLLGVGAVYLCYVALAQSGLFRIAAIDIEGCERISKDEILELSGVSIQSNLVKIGKSRVEELVAGHRWVERAEVARKWPDRLLISIRERKPVAIVNLDDGLYYIDKSGELFAALTGEADLDYPVISGLTAVGEGGLDRSSALREALQIIKYGGRDNPNLPVQNISEIRLGDETIVMFLTDRPFPIRLGRGEMLNKYRRLAKVLYWLYKRKEFERVSYIQVDYGDERVLVGMESG